MNPFLLNPLEKRAVNSFKLETKQQIIDNAIGSYTLGNACKVDKRLKSIKKYLSFGYSENDLLEMRKVQGERRLKRMQEAYDKDKFVTHEDRVKFLQEIKSCKYAKSLTEEDIDGTEDYKVIHRESSNGKGWVIIAPAEPANNWYLEDNIILKLLSKKYLKK
ncbi:hypothetical protein [Capnocytophaga sputigena]|uniref:hypothetical protein n=1 Tax=Capnocytophaga sputigena TaxID=1019 RepID=UPI003C71079E